LTCRLDWSKLRRLQLEFSKYNSTKVGDHARWR